jgi:uncharacterized protein (TIGR02246 family)
MNTLKTISMILVVALSAAGNAASGGLSREDVAKIRQAHKGYEDAWLKGDANGIRALFTEDCVLLPPHGGKPRVGQKGLNEFWFPPDAPPSKITKLELTLQDIGGDGQIAHVWGTYEVAWTMTQEGKTTSESHKGVFLNVLRKQANGEWKFSHHMWDDPIDRH